MVKPIGLFLIWLVFNLLIYLFSEPNLENLVALSFLNVAQIVSLTVLMVTRSKRVEVLLGSIFIICNYLIFKLIDPFPEGIGIFVGLACSISAVIVLVNIKKEGE